MGLYTKVVKPLLFLAPPDYVHASVCTLGKYLGQTALTRSALSHFFTYQHPALHTRVAGIDFANPVGLAGGFDKHCDLIQTMPAIGFGFMEVGSITRYPYGGNRRPWNVRLPRDRSLIVNYGLKNDGAVVARARIAKQTRTIPLIINIAKTNNPNIKGEGTVADYLESFKLLEPLADIVNINISCPNTGDGVLLCENLPLLEKLLSALEAQHPTKPIFLKLKPDIADAVLTEIVARVKHYPSIRGFIISNLSKQRSLLTQTDPAYAARYQGGISGQPIRALSTAMIRRVYQLTSGRYPIIGLGGIFSAADAYEKIKAGASLVELVTGLIYEGPGVVKKINRGLVELLQRDGYHSISEAVGKGV